MNRRDFLKGCTATGILMATSCREPTMTPTEKIKTHSGNIQGEIVDGVHRFLGVPYAEPPFGERRWRAPELRQPWQGTLSATSYGPICPQTGGIQANAPDEGEDCLSLNIWSPDTHTQGLPVMVWAHGGGQVSGSGANATYDGTHFAKDGVVLVTCNRRLGAEGFLYLEEHFGEGVGPGNLGIQDLICVLEWVALNIEQFGGNPNNVTLFGESGGAAATQAVVATPGSKGLVHKVIVQSGGHAAQLPGTAKAVADLMLSELGEDGLSYNALQNVPWHRLVELYPVLEKQQVKLGRPQIYLPVINSHMPVHPADTAHEKVGLDIDYLIGTCRDEMNFFSSFIPELRDTIFHNRAKRVLECSGVSFDDLTRVYQANRPHLDEDGVFEAILGDLWFRVPSIRIAEGHAAANQAKTYMYLFEWESNLIGAAHALDLMVFGNGLPIPGIAGFADYQNTAATMRRAWINFAKEGNPSSEQLAWSQYGEGKSVMSLNETSQLLLNPFQAEQQLLSSVIQRSWRVAGL